MTGTESMTSIIEWCGEAKVHLGNGEAEGLGQCFDDIREVANNVGHTSDPDDGRLLLWILEQATTAQKEIQKDSPDEILIKRCISQIKTSADRLIGRI